jgi:dCTP deaminase
MSLLKDDELVPLVTGNNPIITGLPPPPVLPPSAAGQPIDPWYGRDSAIQASSIDLHIGAILLPNVGKDASGSVSNPKVELPLQLGQTVVIVSSEEVKLPKNIAAFGFPPARLSFRGLLMTNPGHVDPGFWGPLKFTVMNIGKEDITLRKGDPIVTLLFFRLSADVKAGYSERYNLTEAMIGPTQDKVNSLSFDFLDIESRAEKAAVKAVASAEYRLKLWGTTIPAWGALATILSALLFAFFGLWQPANQVKADLEQIKKVLDLRETKSRLDKFEDMEKLQKRVDQIEDNLKSKVVQKAGGGN